MPVRVLVVDDSGFFRRRISEILNSDPRLEVVGEASDGREAVELASSLEPDVITMDIEMPNMDGISAVKKIMTRSPCAILMLSTLTTEGAQATLDALTAGAVDFLPKRLEEFSHNRDEALRQIRSKVFLIGAKAKAAKRKPLKPATSSVIKDKAVSVAPTPQTKQPIKIDSIKVDLVAIGTSTGGPVALQQVLTALPQSFPLPIVLIQHMPGTFTPAFATRLNQLCSIEVKEAEDGDELKPGHAYLAPGGKQMTVAKVGSRHVIQVYDGDPSLNYKPCVDVTFTSVCDLYKGAVLAVVLTGMGADGREGVRKLKAMGATVWAQDEQSSVVYGMPAAIVEAGLADRIMSLSDIGPGMAQGIR